MTFCLPDCDSVCPADVSRAAAELPPSSAFVGDAGIGDQRLAAGRGRGGRGLLLYFRGDGCRLCEGVQRTLMERALRNRYKGKV